MNIIKKVPIFMIATLVMTTSLLSRFNQMQDHFCPNKTLIWGTINFPKTLAIVPDIRIYYAGQRIKCETNQDLRRISYAIPDIAHKTQFSILITDHLEFVSESNVIKYLKVGKGTPYKLYQIDLTRDASSFCSLEQGSDTDSPGHKTNWHIQEYRNALDKERIPDDTIIIGLKSSYVETLESTNANMLPTIKIRADIVQLAGSEKKLHEYADELILSLLDYDTIHAAMHQEEVRPETSPKTVLTITT